MTLQQLKKTISELPLEQRSEFREWCFAFDADNWDQQFVREVEAGSTRPIRR
jgi:hypothetical protein